MAKNINTQVWHIDSSGYTQDVKTLFNSTPPVYTHADHIDNSFNYCVNGVNEQKKRAAFHLTDRSTNTYSVDDFDCTFIPDYIYDNKGNIGSQQISTVFGNSTGGVSNFAFPPDSGVQPLADFKILANFTYLSNVWSPRINVQTYDTSTHSYGSSNYMTLNQLDAESTAEDAEEGETWWAYYKRKENQYILSMDMYNAQTYHSVGAFSSTEVYEGQTRAGIPIARVSWLMTPNSYGNTYGTSGCSFYYYNNRDAYSDMKFDIIFSLPSQYLVKKDEWEDTQYSKPRHNIIYGVKIDRDIIMHIICSYGLPFSFSDRTNISIGNDDYALPEVKNNTTTGNYFRGADAITADTDNNRWANTADIDNKPAGGGGGGGGDDEDNTDPVSTAGAPFGTGLAHYYVTTVDSAVLGQISEALGSWDIDNTKKDLYRNLISCKILKPPAGIPSTPSTFEIYGVKPQYNGADISIPAVNGNPDISFGPYTISRKFNDFRDYAPYTRAEIFLPYCGWCALPSHVVGRSVSVSYFTDVIAGTVKAVVFCEANPVAEAAGVMAYDIPFAAQNVGAKIQAANTGMLAYGKAALQLSAGIGQAVATKGKQGMGSIVNGAFGVAAGYNQLSMAANENYTEISGKAGDGCALAGIDTIIIKIVRPKYGPNKTAPYVPDGFAHTVGFLSMKQAKVSAASGLILCDNVDTSGIGKATDAERAEIKRVLETGLYVNNPPE